MLASGGRTNNVSSGETVLIALEALENIFSWIPLGPHIPTALLVNLVRLAQQTVSKQFLESLNKNCIQNVQIFLNSKFID